jgi:hypothetical protein
MNYTDKQLKAIMAKLLPKSTYLGFHTGDLIYSTGVPVRDTELLHLCWLVEDNLTEKQYVAYGDTTYDLHLKIVRKTKKWRWFAMPWQQRVVALAKVKGIEI